LWDLHGVDRISGGFFEEVAFDAAASAWRATGEIRRGRVVARQIYVFEAGERLGWRSRFSSPIDHGCNFLFSNMHEGGGRFHTSIHASTREPAAPFSLYEHAFYLFALAGVNRSRSQRYPIAETASSSLEWLREHYGKVEGGFEESIPSSVPLKSNPHMHLLEAALAWIDVSHGESRRPWLALAQELVTLCLTYFVDSRTGAIREFFDACWQPLREAGRIVEPGHQFEWAWLLMRWASLPHIDAAQRTRIDAAAARLLDIAERWGVDPTRGVAVNEIWDDMTAKDSAAKLWPQTERLKAWCATLARSRTPSDVARASLKVVAAAEGLLEYLETKIPGLWHEVWSADREFLPGPSKASSLYHIVCAIDELTQTIQTCNRSVL
jgi:mannose-6-phosphate isomerase